MPNNSIYEILNKPVANIPRNGFDVGEFFPYSLKLGQVKPISFTHTVPGGHYRISVDELCHTEPFITDPFVRLSKHIEVIYLPYSVMWHGSSQFFGHAQDPQSSYEQGHEYVPNFNLGNMLERIYNATPSDTDMQGLQITETALSLLDMLGYGAHPLFQMTDNQRNAYITALKTQYVNAWSLLAYNKYWNDMLRDSQHTSPLNPALFNADRVPCTSVETSHMDRYYSDAEMLELVTIKYRKTKRDLFTSSLVSRQFGATELVSLNFTLDPSGLSISGNGQVIANFNGGTAYDTGNYKLPSGVTHTAGDNRDIGLHMTDTSHGNVYAAGVGEVDINSILTHQHAILNQSIYSKIGSVGLNVGGSANGSGSFDVYTLLTAQLMQKWREQINRAGNKTEDRLRAVYGSKPGSDAKNHPVLLGSTSYDIRANQVTSTGEGTNTKLGDIAAKGIGYAQRNQFEFDATEFGIILVCTYILPENAYLNPLDKLNTLIEPFDYYVPQLANLGLEGIENKFKKLLRYDSYEDKYELPIEGPYPDRYLTYLNSENGYAARNWAYKQKINKVHLGFQHGVENSKWMPSRIDRDPSSRVAQNEYYVSPNEYDTVFGTVTDYHLDTDQFIGCAKVNIDCVLPMPELGLPRW